MLHRPVAYHRRGPTLRDRRSGGAALAAALVLLYAPLLHTTPAADAATATFTAEADAYVSADTPGANYGSTVKLEANGSPIKRMYLRFNGSIPQGSVVTRTTLRLYFSSSAPNGYDIRLAVANNWNEGTITFANAPGFTGPVTSPTTIVQGWANINAPLIEPGKPITYLITRAGDVGVRAESREGLNKPQLVIEYAIPSTTPTAISSSPPAAQLEADARVEEAHAATNYGTSSLRTDAGRDPDVETYLRFSVGAFMGRVQSARLRVYAYSSTADGPSVFATGNAWSEGGISWSNRPARTSLARDDKGAIRANTWVEFDVTPLVRSNGSHSFVLATSSDDGVDFYSREASLKPQLAVVTTAGRLESKPRETTMSWGTTVGDFNRDGRDDYLLARHEVDKDQIWLQQPDGTFSPGFKLPPADRHGCTAGDVNMDGRLDIYCMLGASGGEGQKGNELWIARVDGTYVNQAARWGVEDPFGRGRRPIFFNFNRDERIDLYLTNDGPRVDGRRSENILYLNAGDRFVEHAVTATVSQPASCVDAGDWANDWTVDLLVCGPQLQLYRTDHSGQTDRRDWLLGSAPVEWPRDAKLSDLNNDGWLDLVIVKAKELQIRLNLGGGARFSQVHHRVALLDGMSVAIADVTGDGFTDVYVVQGYANGRNWDDFLLAGPAWLPVPIPQTDSGTGDTAQMINVLGRQTVIVTNGRHYSRGPVQLLAFYEG